MSIIERFRMRRRERVLRIRIAELGAYITNNGIYPGVSDDWARLNELEHELDFLREQRRRR